MPFHPLWKLLGDASYYIYLAHAVVSLSIAERLWRHVPVGGWPQLLSWGTFALLVSSPVGIETFPYVEKPILRLLQRRRRVVPAVQPTTPHALPAHDATR